MAAYDDSYALRSGAKEMNGWAVGFIFLAAVMMVILGSFHAIAGMTALFDDAFYPLRSGFSLGIDVTTWGWVHVIGGIVLGVTGLFLLGGSTAARYLTLLFVTISAIWDFYSIPYYPVWSILQLALSFGVLWALLSHGKEFASSMRE